MIHPKWKKSYKIKLAIIYSPLQSYARPYSHQVLRHCKVTSV